MVNLDLYTFLVTKLFYIAKYALITQNTNAIFTTRHDSVKYLKFYKIINVISLRTKIIYYYYYYHHFYMCNYPNLNSLHILRTQYLLLPNWYLFQFYINSFLQLPITLVLVIPGIGFSNNSLIKESSY